MTAIGGMNITGSTLMATSVGSDPHGTGDFYVFDIDLSVTPNFTISWDFEEVTATEFNYYFDPAFTFPAGTPSLGAMDGLFSYNVTLADAVAAGMTTATFSITGWQGDGFGGSTSDTDTITFNFTLCFAEGTGIATPGGERSVEDLQIGNVITTADGRSVPIKWIGRTSIDPMFNPADRLEPVRISAGALGANTPTRDLVVTADHGMVLDGYVINASALTGFDGIDWFAWKTLGRGITYYHIETDAQDVILANGAAAETYVDAVGRRSFDNFAEYEALYGDEAPVQEMPMPRISSARLIPGSVRARLTSTKVA